MNFEKWQMGSVFGIPVVIDVTFILIAVLYGLPYFTSGDPAAISYGLFLIAGIALSILLHEFGHAAGGHFYGVPATHVELNGFGGLCHFARAIPPDRMANIVVLLAGPAVTGVLWLGFQGLSYILMDLPESIGAVGGIDRLSSLAWHLGQINFYLLIFNLLPSHPLDGGRSLAHLLSRWIGYDRAMRLIAMTGMCVVAWLVLQGLQGATFAFLVAFLLYQANMEVLQTHQGPRWQRWN